VFDISERSLCRKLKLEGQAFKSILLNVGGSMVLEYLKGVEHTVTEIEHCLGVATIVPLVMH